MFGLPAILIAAGGYYWLTSGGSVSTDNAYVQMDKVSVAAEVGGRITEVAVRDGQQVAAGQLLFRIDGEPYALNVAQATAAIDAAQVEVGNLSASANDVERRYCRRARGCRVCAGQFRTAGGADGERFHHPRGL